MKDQPVGAPVSAADVETQIRIPVQRLAAAGSGEPVWVLLPGHLFCLLKVAQDNPQHRALIVKALRDGAAVVEAMGDAQGDAVKPAIQSRLQRMFTPTVAGELH